MSNKDIEELVKTSKQMQIKFRKELRRHAANSSISATVGDREELPPIWDRILLNPYVKNVVADYLQDGSNLTNESVQFEDHVHIENTLRNDESQDKENNFQAIKTTELHAKESIVSSSRKAVTVSTQVSQNQLQPQEALKEKVKNKLKGKPLSLNKNVTISRTKLNSQSGRLDNNKRHSESINFSVSTLRLPLQRFAETVKGSLDFSQEHPNLELDTTPNQTTLFPRRFYKGAKGTPLRPSSPDNDSINLAAAKIKTPEAAVVKQKTWKEVLSKNRTSQKVHKVLQLKKSVGIVESSKKISNPEIKESNGLDIISNSANALFRLEKQSARLSKPNKCNLQRFPVMYIRPECQVQRVANISIRGDCKTNQIYTTAENLAANVKYVECIHEQDLEVKNYSPIVEKAVTNEKHNEEVPKKENKFFKALELTEPLKTSSSSIGSSFASKSRSGASSSSSSYLRSAPNVKKCSSSQSIATSDNDMHNIIERMLSSPDRPHRTTTKDFIKKLPTRREAYVQTDYNDTTAASPPSLPTPPPPPPTPPGLTSSIINHHPIPISHSTTKQEDDNLIEDDFITKIFERIRNDIPNALQAFKDRHTRTHEAVPPEFPTIKQHQEQQRHHYQMSAISNASNVDRHPNEIQPGLVRVQEKRHHNSHAMMQMTPPVDSPVTIPPPAVGDEYHKFPLLQQNPLFVQTINRIKSSAVHDATSGDGGKQGDRHKYPTDAEIRRAVKIFLESLKLECSAGSGGRKSINKGGDIRRRVTIPTPLISGGKVTKYTSSDSSNTSDCYSSSSRSRRQSNILHCDVSRSSTSTTISFTDLELESDVTAEPPSQQSAEMLANSHSEGEVLSIGEI